MVTDTIERKPAGLKEHHSVIGRYVMVGLSLPLATAKYLTH